MKRAKYTLARLIAPHFLFGNTYTTEIDRLFARTFHAKHLTRDHRSISRINTCPISEEKHRRRFILFIYFLLNDAASQWNYPKYKYRREFFKMTNDRSSHSESFQCGSNCVYRCPDVP